MTTSKVNMRASNEERSTSSDIRDLAWSLSPAAFYASDYPIHTTPLVITFWNAHGDKAELQKLGFDFDNLIWRSFDIQPMAKYVRPYDKVASKGHNGQYKLVEASEEFGLPMTSQKKLIARYQDGEPRTDREPVQHCAVDDAVNTVRLTGLLLEDLAKLDLLSSVETGAPSQTVWPPDGLNIRLISIDTESCCLPEDMNRPRGYKYPTFMSELGVASIDTNTIRTNPDGWQDYITTAHAIVAEHWDHHPHRGCQEKMGIDDRLAFYPRFNASTGPSGSLQEQRTFTVNGECFTVWLSPDTEIVSRDNCLQWLLNKIHQEVPQSMAQ